MGGWLSLTQLGLAPNKKHQALLGALTFGHMRSFAIIAIILLNYNNFIISNHFLSIRIRAKFFICSVEQSRLEAATMY
jgi:hypothetical protein